MAGLVTGMVAGMVALGVAAAGPALAVDDPTRPDARVTHGPSCRPGGVGVEVVGGTVAYDVVLATTRQPGGEDSARVEAGQAVQLSTGDVDWGETIDSRLVFTALDGSGVTYVDDLAGFEFTRPAEEDCAAIAPPPGGATVPPMSGSTDGASGTGTDDLPAGGVPMPGVGAGPGPAGSVAAPGGVTSSVAAGELVTLTASGFAAGEEVVLRLGDGTDLGTSVADIDGLVAVEVRIPAGAPTGATTLEVVGAVTSTTVEVDLRIAADSTPVHDGGDTWPLVLVGATLAVAGGGLGIAALRRRARQPASGGA